MEAMTLSHRLQMGDALIAVTALEHGLPALIGKVKHFSAVPGLRIEGFAIQARELPAKGKT
jgi:predicted nucleic acid-binding protein